MGKGQLYQGMYVVGEDEQRGEIHPPARRHLIDGNTLDKLSDRNFAFSTRRPRSHSLTDLRYGTGRPLANRPSKKIKDYRTWAEAFPRLCDMMNPQDSA